MSLTLRLTLTYLLITLVGVLLLGAAFVAVAGMLLSQQRERELGAQAEIYAALLAELALTPGTLQAVAPSAELLPPGTSARVFSPAGALLAGDPALGPFPSRAALPLLRPPLPLPASQVEGRRYTARTIDGPAGAIGVLELSRANTEDDALLAVLRRAAALAALAAAALAALVSFAVARSIARPIVGLTRRAELLAAGVADGQPGPPTPPRDEIAALAGSLNHLEDGLRRYLARINELEQARARFYRSVSHELRTPLTAISAGLENLADAAPVAQRPALIALEDESARLRRLVDELLRPPDDGMLPVRSRATIDLGVLIADVCGLLAGRAARSGVALSAAGGSLLVRGDRDRLKQALINLVDNALRATPLGGSVRLAAEGAPGAALLVVEDSGPGVPPELRERIWERGVRGDDPATQGAAGFGLAIVREIAAAHNGRAYLDTRPAGRTRFVIELPNPE